MKSIYYLFIVILAILTLESCKVQSDMYGDDANDTDIRIWSSDLKTIYVAVPDNYKELSYTLYTDENSTKESIKLTSFVEKKDKGINIFIIQNSLSLLKLEVVIGEIGNKKVRKVEFSKENISNYSNYNCYKADQDICAIEAVIFRETNAFRKSRGYREFQSSLSVSYVARDWSYKQARMGGISHAGFSASRVAVLNTLKSDSSLDANTIRGLFNENVAMMGGYGSNAESLGKAFTNMWLNSSGHLANILTSNTYLGVGVAKTNNGTYYATQIFAQ